MREISFAATTPGRGPLYLQLQSYHCTAANSRSVPIAEVGGDRKAYLKADVVLLQHNAYPS
jgi:hypothetical protein